MSCSCAGVYLPGKQVGIWFVVNFIIWKSKSKVHFVLLFEIRNTLWKKSLPISKNVLKEEIA